MYNSLKEKIREEGKERQAFRESLAQTLVNAHMAGRQAAADCEPTPMVVGNHEKAVQLWIHDYGQSVERKAAYASAYSEVLAAWAAENDEKAKIWSGSRLD